ncbi:MAG TPA: beta-propeller fold lactonase family protein [Xanthomonadaceae bacterium]|nr:beta-propeller fold lactonase family protein [Xanthomonadaceae bacterium]
MSQSTAGRFRAAAGFTLACVLLVSGAAAHAQAVPTLSFAGPDSYTPGTTGNVYTLIVGNTGDATASGVSVTTDFPAQASIAFTCVAVGAGSGCGAGGGSGSGNVNRSVNVADGGSVTFTLTVAFGSSMTADPLVVTGTAGALAQQVSSDLELESDVSVSKTSASAEYVPGTADSYTVVVANAGPSDVTGVGLVDNAPTGMTFTTWSCAPSVGASCPNASGSGSIDEADLAIPAGGSLTYTLNVSTPSSASAASIVNTATISVPAAANDPDTDNHASAFTKTRRAETDLRVVFTPSLPSGAPGQYIPGTTANALTLTATNLGPTDSSGATLTMDFPAEVEAATWQCNPLVACTPNAGTDTGSVVVALNAASFTSGSSITVSIALDYDSAALEPSIEVDAGIEVLAASGDIDTDTDNNSATNVYEIDRRADIRVLKTSNVETANPGAAFIYSITVSNLGPSDVGHEANELGILLSDTFPTSLRGDPDPLRCGVEDTAVCWDYCVSDGGTVDDVDPDNCPEGVESFRGTGNIQNEPFQLRKGSSSTLWAYVAVGGTASGSISNTATISLDAPDVTEVNPGIGVSSTDVLAVEIGTDLSVTKTDGTDSAVPGTLHSYTVVVRNDGFITASNVAVHDALPLFPAAGTAGFVPGSISWQCQAFNGACCNHNSSVCGVGTPTAPVTADVLTSAVDLPGQSRVEYTISGQIHARATGTLVNTATATPPPDIVDSNLDNNTATDDDTVLSPQAVLNISKRLVTLEDGADDNFILTYEIVVSSSGPSHVAGALISDDLGDPDLDSAEATWTCEVTVNPGNTSCAAASGSGALAPGVGANLDPGGALRVMITVPTVPFAIGTVVNTAEVTSAAGSASATITSGLSGRANLDISKTDNRETAIPGASTDYVITLRNNGPDAVFGARVVDVFPPELQNVSWTCESTTPVPGDLGFRQVAGQAGAGGHALAVSPDGRHVYVVGNEADSLFVFSRDNVPGLTFGQVAALETEVNGQNDGSDPGGVVTGMAQPIDVVLSPDGQMVYVLSKPDGGDPAIAAFSRIGNPAHPDFGKVSFAGSITTGVPVAPRRIIATAANVYVSGMADIDNVSTSVVSIFRRDPVSGVPIHDIQHVLAVPSDPGPMAVSHAEARLFVASAGAGQVARFAINTTAGATPIGRLSSDGSTSNAFLGGADDLAIVPASGHLYVRAASAGRITQVVYDGDGLAVGVSYQQSALTLPGGMGNPLTGPGRIAVAPDGEHLLASSREQGALLSLRRDTVGGGLEFESVSALLENAGDLGLTQAADLAVSGDGRHVLVAAAQTGTGFFPLTVYSRSAPDPLFAFIERDRLAPGAGLLAPTDVAVSRDGRHVYAVSLPDNALTVFNRFNDRGLTDDTAGQHLEFVETYFDGIAGVSGIEAPRRVLVSPDGMSVYVTSQDRDSLAVFDRNNDPASGNFGRLSFRQVLRDSQGGVTALLGAHGLAMDADNRHLYVAASFESAIGVFRRNADRSLSFIGEARGGVGGATGLAGIRDLVVTRDRGQVIGVSAEANTAVVFNRDNNSASSGFGRLAFRQSLPMIGANRPVSISIPGANDPADVEHVYIVAQNSHTLHVLKRIVDPTSPAFGTLQNLFVYSDGSGGIAKMRGPRDVAVSGDGKRVYVASEVDHSVLAFDRDLNRSSASFGGLNLAEVRTDNVDGVDGIRNVYAVAVSSDSRHVYAAGFGDSAVASFAVGTGSTCSAGGGGDIDDLVDIGVGGTLVYRANATIRPDALGVLLNTATVSLPERFSDPDDPDITEFSDFDSTTLTPRGDLSISKTNSQVSVVAGEVVTYEVVVRNAGPSNLIHTSAAPVVVTDILSTNPAFVADSISWTCVASGSGALDFIDVYADSMTGIDGLGGVSGLTLIPDNMALPGRYLAAASVLDSSVTLFERDPLDGRLTQALRMAHGDMLNGVPLTALDGARALAASADGRFLYVASRTSDAVNVFELSDGGGVLRADLVEVQQGFIGLDQALHLVLSPDGGFLYVAGANDNAIAGFARNADTGHLTWIESEQNGVNDPTDPGGTVAGLENVEFLVISPGGAHLYALSASGGSIARFDRDVTTGLLTWRSVRSGSDFGVAMDGASSALFDADGRFLYITAATANRVVVLQRNIDPGSGGFGTLSFASSVAQGVGGTQGLLAPRRAALSADGSHLYVTAQSGAAVSWFIRDPADGSLKFLGLRSNESSEVDGLAGATGIVIDNDLNQVYVAGTLQASLVQFERRIDSFCPASGIGDLDHVPIHIAAGGQVTFNIQVQIATQATGTVANTATVASPLDPEPGNNEASDSDVVSVVADLAITKDDGLAEYDGLAGARALTGDANHLYVAGADDNAIGAFVRVNAPGEPEHGSLRFLQVLRSAVNGVVGLGGVADILLSDDGAHVYAVSPTENSISTFVRALPSGRLTYLETDQNGVLGVTGMAGARAVAQSPDGQHLYVAGAFSNAIAVFRRNAEASSPDFGRLAFLGMVQNAVGGVMGLEAPIALAVSPDGMHVYALGNASDSVAVFQRNPNPGSSGFGMLAFITHYADGVGGIFGLDGARSLALSADGEHLYVLGTEEGSLVHFTRNAGNGHLSPAALIRDGIDGVSGLAGASRIRLSPLHDHLYVAAAASNAVAHFHRESADGSLAFAGIRANGDPAPLTGGQVIGLGGASDVMVSADGDQLYAVSRIDNALTVFQRDHDVEAGNSGELDYREAFFDGLGGVAPGESVTYLIAVENHGPSNVAQARVVDTFPPEFESVTWECTGSGGGLCPLSGVGNIDTIVSLPVGARVTFAATGVVSNLASGRLVNTATVTGIGVVDPNPGNNSATDDDTVLSPATDLVAAIDDDSDVAIPGGRIDYSVTIASLGPSYAGSARVSDIVPAALHSVEWSCHAEPVAGVLDLLQTVPEPLDRVTAIAASALGQYVYASGTHNGIGSLAVYRRDPLSGALDQRQLLQNGSGGVSGIAGAAHLVLSSDERFVYVAGQDSDAVAVFARDGVSGELSFLARYVDGEFGIDGIGGVRRLLMGPGGNRLYAAGMLDDAIAVFTVNASSGLLTPSSLIRQSDAGVDGLNGVSAIAWTANDSHLLAVATDNQSLSAFARHPSTGALSFVATIQNFQVAGDALLGALDVVVDGERIFVAASGGHQVAEFRFAAGGSPVFSLQQVIADGIGNVAGLMAPEALVFDPDQARLYVAGADALHLFSLLAEVPDQLARYDSGVFPMLDGVAALALSPNNRQLYAGGEGIGAFARERGSRCPLNGTRKLATHTVDIAPGGWLTYMVSGEIYPNATGLLEYQVRVDTQIADQEINPADNVAIDIRVLTPAPDLGIAKRADLDEVVAGLGLHYIIDVDNAGVSDALEARVTDAPPVFPDIDPGVIAGEFEWTCAANLPLAPLALYGSDSHPVLAGVGAMVLAPDGTRLYAVNPDLDALLVFPRALDGSLADPAVIADGSSLGDVTVSGLAGASDVTVTSDGRHVLVTGSDANSLVVLGWNATSGSHEFVQKLTTGTGGVFGLTRATTVTVSRDGKAVYVGARGQGGVPPAIVVFARNTDSGLLTFIERVADGLGTILPDSNVLFGVRRLHLSEDGRHLYAVASQSNAISAFAVNPTTGTLGYLGALKEGANGIAALAGARALLATPGDEQIYVLGDTSIGLFQRHENGQITHAATFGNIPSVQQTRSMAMRPDGSRLYLADSDGALHVFARDWSNGDLERRYSLDAAVPGGAGEILYAADLTDLYLGTATPGAIAQIDELALSRCLSDPRIGAVLDEVLDLGVGGWAELGFGVTVHPSARGVLANTASIAPGSGSDPDMDNNSATALTPILVVSDIAIEKTAPVQAVAGAPINFQIRVTNEGPSTALGIRVVDTLHPALSDATWTCTATVDSSCPSSGNGHLDMEADVFPGGELNIVLTATIASSFTGILPNTASLVPEIDSTDPTPDDHESSTETEVIAVADAQVVKSNGVDVVVAGTDVTYTITVSNPGPSDAPEVQVLDMPPASLSDIVWTCAPSGAATCPAGGTGNINFVAALPAGDVLDIVLTARLSPAATGTLSNTASIVVLGDVEDPDLDNNQSTDSDPIGIEPDLWLRLIDPLNPFDPAGGFDLPIVALVTNLGPSNSSGGELLVEFDHPLVQTFDPDCVPEGTHALRCPIPAQEVGLTHLVRMDFGNLPPAPGSLTVDGEVFAFDDDPDLSNNTDSITNHFATGGDVLVYVENGLTSLVPGRAIAYRVLLINIGSLPVNDVQLSVPIAEGLLNATWSCIDVPGNLCEGSGSGDIVATYDLPPAAFAEYQLQAVVDPFIEPQVQPTIAQWVHADVPPDSDINLANNEWVDEDPLVDIIFSNGFETLTETQQALQPKTGQGAPQALPWQRSLHWLQLIPLDGTTGGRP